jgi:hypothetical protein
MRGRLVATHATDAICQLGRCPRRRSGQAFTPGKGGESGTDSTRVREQGRRKHANAAQNAQTERDYHFDTTLADIARALTVGLQAGSGMTARRAAAGQHV